eukprot:5764496-Alexandrium_andersonii.AAC.1
MGCRRLLNFSQWGAQGRSCCSNTVSSECAKLLRAFEPGTARAQERPQSRSLKLSMGRGLGPA